MPGTEIEIGYKDKFIAFVDILGFKDMIEKSVGGNGRSAFEILDILRLLGTQKIRESFVNAGRTICPKSTFTQHDLDFHITQVSDCVIMSSEISPAGAINIVNECSLVAENLLQKGILCRGYISRGIVYHNGNDFFGTGYQNTYAMESEVTAFKQKEDKKGTPFVEIDSAISDYIEKNDDGCINKHYKRMVKSDGKVTALFPFQNLQHSFIVGDYHGHKFDQNSELMSNDNVRRWIEQIKASIDTSSPNAVKKGTFYIKALNEQLEVCDRVDRILHAFQK